MSYNDLIQSIRQYRPETDKNKGRLSDKRVSEIVNDTLHSALPPIENTPKPTLEDINSRWNKATGKGKRSGDTTLTSALPHIENFDYGPGKGNSVLPRKDNTDIGGSGISLSEEGQQRYMKESRAYRDAVTRYKKAVPGSVSDEFLRTRPTLDQLKAAARGVTGASLDTIYKKWRAATGQKRR